MILVNATPFYDIHNSGWVYLGVDDSGNYWIRDVIGKWAQIPSPGHTLDIVTDFATFTVNNQPVTLAQVNADDEQVQVVPPIIAPVTQIKS